MELADIVKNRNAPGFAIAAIVVCVILAGGAMMLFGSLPVTCGADSECFNEAINQCAGASFEFTDKIPIEGEFSYEFRTGTKEAQFEKSCVILYSLNVTKPDGKSRFSEGECKLLDFDDTSLQFNWEKRIGLPGECLRLERKLSGIV